MPEALLAPRFLFRFSTPLLYQKRLWTDKGVQLGPKHRLINLAELPEE